MNPMNKMPRIPITKPVEKGQKEYISLRLLHNIQKGMKLVIAQIRIIQTNDFKGGKLSK